MLNSSLGIEARAGLRRPHLSNAFSPVLGIATSTAKAYTAF